MAEITMYLVNMHPVDRNLRILKLFTDKENAIAYCKNRALDPNTYIINLVVEETDNTSIYYRHSALRFRGLS